MKPAASVEPPLREPPPSLADLLNRSGAERCREYKYRFAQSVVFGLPVLALRLFGASLGGPESARWVGLISALLAGWVVYVGALPMLFEALLRRRLTLDGVAAAIAAGAYLVGFVALLRLLFTARQAAALYSAGFAGAVVVAILWNGMRYAWRRRC